MKLNNEKEKIISIMSLVGFVSILFGVLAIAASVTNNVFENLHAFIYGAVLSLAGYFGINAKKSINNYKISSAVHGIACLILMIESAKGLIDSSLIIFQIVLFITSVICMNNAYKKSNNTNETKLCKHCSAKIPKNAYICPICQSKIRNHSTIGYVVTILLALIIIGSLPSNTNNDEGVSQGETGIEVLNKKPTELKGETGIEVTKNQNNQLQDFDYEIIDNRIVFDSYDGENDIIELSPTYNIDGKEYISDLTNFQIGIGNDCVKTVIFNEGITEINHAVFNSCDVQKVFFPKSITVVYDYLLSYMHPEGKEDGNTIKVYYAGTKEEWLDIFEEYKRTKIEDSKLGEEMGTAIADKFNEMIGSEYDSSLFEYFFSATPNDLK